MPLPHAAPPKPTEPPSKASQAEREPYGLVADQDGKLRISGLPRSYSEGFGSLLDLFHPPARFRIMPPEEITRISFERVGASLRHAMTSWRNRTLG